MKYFEIFESSEIPPEMSDFQQNRFFLQITKLTRIHNVYAKIRIIQAVLGCFSILGNRRFFYTLYSLLSKTMINLLGRQGKRDLGRKVRFGG